MFEKCENCVINYIGDKMEAFDEAKEIPEYDANCYCKGRIANRRSEEQLIIEIGTLDEARKKLSEIKIKKKLTDKQSQKQWTKDFYEPREKRLKEILSKQSDRNEPDKKCNECKGTGIEKSTYNPRSKWDWFRVGGRWDGWLVNKQNESRDKEDGGFNFGEEHTEINNNSRQIKLLKKDHVPFALIDSDGEWFERGSMGWFGMVSEEKADKKWDQEIHKLLKKENQEDYVISLDAHI